MATEAPDATWNHERRRGMSACPLCGEAKRIRRERRGENVFSCEVCRAEWTPDRAACPRCGRQTLVVILKAHPAQQSILGERVKECYSCGYRGA